MTLVAVRAPRPVAAMVSAAGQVQRRYRGSLRVAGAARHRRPGAPADAASRLRPSARARDRAGARDASSCAVARRAGGGRAGAGKRHPVRGDLRAAEGDRGAVHRARHGFGVPLRQPHHGAGFGPRAARRPAGARSPRTRRCAPSISGPPPMAEPLLRVEGVRAGYGEAVVIDDIGFTLGEGESLAVLGRNGMGKTTLILTLMGQTRLMGGADESARHPLRALADQRARRAGPGLGAAGAQHFPLAHRRGKSRRRGAPGPLERGARVRAVSRASPSGGAISATNCRAASSRCWRSPAR